MKKIIPILCSILVFALCIYFCYFKTKYGLSTEYMIVSGAPYWFGAIIFCLFMPTMIYIKLDEYINK